MVSQPMGAVGNGVADNIQNDIEHILRRVKMGVVANKARNTFSC